MKRVTPLKTGAVLNVSELAERIARRLVCHYWTKMGWDISHRMPDLREEACGGIALSLASGESDLKGLARGGYREAQKFLRHGSRETVSLTHYLTETAPTGTSDLESSRLTTKRRWPCDALRANEEENGVLLRLP